MGLLKKKDKYEREEQEEAIQKIVKRLESEEKSEERVKVEARLLPSPPNQRGANIKIKLRVLDPSFYTKGAQIFYNAGTQKFTDYEMEKLDMDNYAIILENVPREIQVIYYVKLLDKSGNWTQFPRPELIDPDGLNQEEPYYSFFVESDGTIRFKELWQDSSLINCPVCGYACDKTWKKCPECRTPLYDTTQEVFMDAQKEKEKRLEDQANAEPEWEDAADESWRTLPECPSCGYTVQLEWSKCPVCDFDLTSVDLKPTASYEEFMSEEEKEKMAQKQEKKKEEKIEEKRIKKEQVWEEEDEDNIDIL